MPGDPDSSVPRVDQIEPEMLRAAFDEAIGLVSDHLPVRAYNSIERWRTTATLLLARMVGMLQGLRLLVGTGLRSEGLVLVRELYEHVVTLCWFLIDPEPRLVVLRDHALNRQRNLHDEALPYGMVLLTAEELAETEDKQGMPKLPRRAAEVDDCWGPRIRGFRVNPESGVKDLLTFRGLYVGLYMKASEAAHPTLQGLDACFDATKKPEVVRLEDDHRTDPLGLALPLFALALLVSHHVMGWPPEEEDELRVLGESLYAADR